MLVCYVTLSGSVLITGHSAAGAELVSAGKACTSAHWSTKCCEYSRRETDSLRIARKYNHTWVKKDVKGTKLWHKLSSPRWIYSYEFWDAQEQEWVAWAKFSSRLWESTKEMLPDTQCPTVTNTHLAARRKGHKGWLFEPLGELAGSGYLSNECTEGNYWQSII